MTDFPQLLRVLTAARVDFIIVGGAAATAHGSVRLTLDLDIVYLRTPENIERLVAALAFHAPYLRDAPAGLPFLWDAATLQRGLNFTLTTSLGALDVFGEIAGGGTYDRLLPDTLEIEVFGATCRCLTLSRLIDTKRAAGRARDFEAIAELEAIRDEQAG